MSSEEQRRREVYEYGLGRRGTPVGTMVSARGFQDYQREQKEKKAWDDWVGQPVPPSFPILSPPAQTRAPDYQTLGGAPDSGSAGIGDAVAAFAAWVTEHVWPLKLTLEAGGRLTAVRWRVRLPLSILGALLVCGLLLPSPRATLPPWSGLDDLDPLHAQCLSLGLGALIGWVAPSLLGAVMIMTALTTGLALGLATIAAGIAFVCWIIAGHPEVRDRAVTDSSPPASHARVAR